MTDQSAYLTVDELGEYLRVSRTTAYNMVRAGRVPRIRIGGTWRIPRQQLEQHLADLTTSGDFDYTPVNQRV